MDSFAHEFEHIAPIIISSMSLVACFLMITTWRNFSVPNYISRHIVTSLGVSGFCTAAAFLMSIIVDGSKKNTAASSESRLCYLQAIMLLFSCLSSYLWTACFAFHLYQIIVEANELPQKYLWVYRLISWGIPTIFLVYLILEQLSGDIGFGNADRRWCWITSTLSTGTEDSQMVYNSRGAWRQLYLFYFPIVLVLIFNATIYVWIIQFLSKDPMNGTFKQKAAMYIAVVLLCPLWGFMNRVIQMTNSDHKPSTPFTLLECVFDPLQPLLNALIYGSNRLSVDACKERFFPSSFYQSLPSSEEDDDFTGRHTSSNMSCVIEGASTGHTNDFLHPFIEEHNLSP